MNMTALIIPRRVSASKVVVNSPTAPVYAKAANATRTKKSKKQNRCAKETPKVPHWKEHRPAYRRFIARPGRIHASLQWGCPITALVKSEQDRRLKVIKAISEEPRLDNPEKHLIEFMCKPGRDGIFTIYKVLTTCVPIRLTDITSHEEFLLLMFRLTVRSVPRDSDAVVYCNDTEFVERLHCARRQQLRDADYRDLLGHPIPNADLYRSIEEIIGQRWVSVRYPEPTYKNTKPYGRGYLLPLQSFLNS